MTQLRMMAYTEKAVALIFFSGAFGRFIANLHLTSREVTRLVLINDCILDLKEKNSHLRIANIKLPVFCS